MVVNFKQARHCYLIGGYTDLRKGIDGLAAIVTSELGLSLFDDSVFLFCGKRVDRFKALWFDGEGFYLIYKRYDQGKLRWPKNNGVEKLSQKQLDWLFDGVLYHSAETRKYEVAEAFLSNFSGYLHCDGYVVYQKLDHVKLQSCWAHVRRKFIETRDNQGQGNVGVDYCDQLFALEKQWRTLSPTERLKERQIHARPVVDTFFRWLDNLEPMKGALQNAYQYTLKLKESLQAFLDHGELVISNNLAERSIRPITVGRKNWYFSTSAEGADRERKWLGCVRLLNMVA